MGLGESFHDNRLRHPRRCLCGRYPHHDKKQKERQVRLRLRMLELPDERKL